MKMRHSSRLIPRLWTLVAAIVLTLAVPSMCEAGETTRQPRNEDGMAPSVITNPGARFQDNARPGAIKRMNAFYTEMTEKRGYSKKPIMLARSRGGLTCLGWAVEHPDKVAAFAGIYPVCNILGWSDVSLGAYGLKKDSSPEQIKMFNPVDRLKRLAEAKVPLFAVHGDNDKAVPLELNSGLLKERYTAQGGTMQLLVAPGAPHGTWKREGVPGDGFFRCQELVDFVKAHARP